MKILNFLLIALLSIAAGSCREREVAGNGATGTDTRNITKPFSRIEIDAPVNAHISLAPGGTAIAFTGYANLLKNIQTEVRDSTLHIFIPEFITLHTDHNVEATITCPALNALAVSGTGAARVSGILTTKGFSCEASGSAQITIDNLQSDKLAVDASGATMVSIVAGRVRAAAFDISGTASVKAYGLESQQAGFEGSGHSSAEIAATTALTISASGTTTVRFKGAPKVTADLSGTASVYNADGTPVPANRHDDADNDTDEEDDDADSTVISW